MVDVEFIPIPDRVLTEMLRMADVGAADVVYDLGCGDGRIVIRAAKERGARGVGVDLDLQLLAQALLNAMQAGVAERVRFFEQNFFETDLRPATVLALYLLDSLNVRLRPRIFAQCRPGTRIVTYSFEMGDWEPDAHLPFAANGVSLWIVPANVSGTWTVRKGGAPSGIESLHLEQRFQRLSGTAVLGGRAREILDGRVIGERFEIRVAASATTEPVVVSGRIDGERIEAAAGVTWSAEREAGSRRECTPA